MKKLACAIGMFALSHLLLGEFKASEYDTFKATETFRDYFTGFGRAFTYANVELTRRGQKPLFCQPRELKLNADNYMQMLDEAVKVWRSVGGPTKMPDMTLEILLSDRLQVVFPCDTPRP